MSILSRLFGRGAGREQATETVEYQGFRIIPKPMKEAGGYRIAARLEKDVGGEVKRHDLIRADVCTSLEEAKTAALAKAKSLIDEQGETIFD